MSDYEWTIEITPTARAAISREIKAQWDGRELGGALVGHTDGERIVVSNANAGRAVRVAGDAAGLNPPGAKRSALTTSATRAPGSCSPLASRLRRLPQSCATQTRA
jgi:hypothetical protein